jgi:S-adenosylmethionine hydrolase
MKGVILSACPRARVVDISHNVPPHDVLAGAFVLDGAAPYFPRGTVHVVVVDPGVGTDRRILAGRFAGQTYIFPDNGVITLIAERGPAEELVVVRNPDYLPGRPASMTFHGRDIFAPIAGQVLNGLRIGRLGPQPQTYQLLDIPACEEAEAEIVGQVVYVDGFGNLVSNIPERAVRGRWMDLESVRGWCAGRDVGCLQGAYDFVGAGEPVLLFNSMGRVEVAVNRGRASEFFNAGIGTVVRLAGR